MEKETKHTHETEHKANATKTLLARIISWEKDLSEYESLESIINQQFFVMERVSNNGYTNYEALQTELSEMKKEREELVNVVGEMLDDLTLMVHAWPENAAGKSKWKQHIFNTESILTRVKK